MNVASYTVGPDDLAAANRLHFLRSFSSRRSAIAFIFSVIAVALMVFGFDDVFGPNSYFLVLGSIWGVIAAICVFGWLAIPWQARRSWDQAQKMWTEQRVTWDPDKIHWQSDRGDVHVLLGNYYRWAADARSLLLYQDSRTFYLVPLRSLPAGARETITNYLRAAGVRER